MKRRIRGLLLATLVLQPGAGPAAASLDEDLYARLLERHTRVVPDTARVRVDYRAIRSDPDWRRLVAGLDGAAPAPGSPRPEKLAFWINAYNVLAIDVVAAHYPIDGIRDIGSLFRPVWKREVGTVGGEPVSLDRIEHEILRPLGDPRIHAAIVCASVSCPALRREPYRAGTLDAQLDDAMTRWLADRDKGLRTDPDGRTLTLSRIFDWFEDDFADRGGVLAFLRPYLGEDDRAWLDRHPDPAIRYFDYDWRLNDLAAASQGAAAAFRR